MLQRFTLRFAFLFAVFLMSVTSILAQGTIRGKVADNYGEPLPFVNIYLKDNTTVGATTDFNGLYSISVPTSGVSVVVFSSIGMQQKNFEVDLKEDEVFLLNVVMEEMSVMIEEGAVITAKANRGGDGYMQRMQSSAAKTFDYISSQTLKKTGDSNVPDAVKRVTGVSTVGGYVSVRGLVDRYIKTTVNGSTLPTLDPFTNNVRLDIFPTGLIDNVMIVKTMTPDLPGDWSGAFLSIETKDFPEQLQLSVTSSFGYNPQASFQEVLTSQRGSMEWLGFDNGFRDISDGVPTVQNNFPNPINPGLWDQFSFLGITDELANYGLTENTPWANGNIYHQVALSELGFLAPAQFNNDIAVQLAIDEYSAQYTPGLFFTAYNQELENIGTQFKNTWFTTTRTAPMDFSQGLTIGNQTTLFGRPLGFVVGMRYSARTQYDPNSVLQRTLFGPDVSEEDGVYLPNGRDYKQQVSRETRGWSALADLSYKLNENNTISFLVMPNFRGQNKARRYEGLREDIFEITLGDDQLYEERRQILYQVETEHFIPTKKIRIDFDASFTDGQRNILDFKDVRYLRDPDGLILFNSTFNPDRRFRYMDEELLDTRLSVEIPIFTERTKESALKFGGAYRYNTRRNQQVVYTMVGLNEEDLETFGFEDVMGLDRFLIQDSTSFDLYYNNSSVVDDSDIGFSHITAGFAMMDFHASPIIRLVGGLRVEHTDMLVDIRKFYEEDFALDSEERVNGNGQLLNPGTVNSLDFLPSINFIYKLRDDDRATMNLRANYSRSLARPSFREMSAVSLFDYELIARVRGNTELEMTRINNFDVRYETFFNSGNSFSVSGFYKTFENHIELIQAEGGVFTWQNAEASEIFGVEIEGKIDLTKHLEARANLTLINSETTITIPETRTRSMFGQAPFIVNSILSYTADSLGLTISASYNVQGPKLAVVASSGVDVPDVYEMPRHLIDAKVDKQLGDHWSISLRIRDLLNSPILRQYKFDSGYILDFDRYQFGPVYNFSITYRI